MDRLALVGVINVDMQEQAMTLTRSVGEEIAVKIRLQRALEVEFQRLIEQQQMLRNQSNKVKKEVWLCKCPMLTIERFSLPSVSLRAIHAVHCCIDVAQ